MVESKPSRKLVENRKQKNEDGINMKKAVFWDVAPQILHGINMFT
jgi:hypothetical protein